MLDASRAIDRAADVQLAVLFFELFPAFVAVMSAAIGVGLFLLNRRTQSSGEVDAPRSPSRPAVSPAEANAGGRRTRRRPSMSA